MSTIKPGDKVRAPMREGGHVVRLERKHRQEGAIVQWPGRQYADWHPLRTLERVESGDAA